MSIFAKLDPVVKVLHFDEFDSLKPLQVVSKKIGMGCRPAHLVLVLGVVLTLFMVLELGSFVIGSLVGLLYPAYMSFKALETENNKDDKQWLTYWIIFSFLTVFDGVIGTVLYFIPFYNFFKMTLYIYLFHPKTRGAEQIYFRFLEPLLSKYEAKIDELLAKGEQKLSSAAGAAKNKLK